MTRDFVRFLLAAVAWTAVLFALAAAFTGCAQIEGDGFTNTGRPKGPVKCEEVAARHIKCRSE